MTKVAYALRYLVALALVTVITLYIPFGFVVVFGLAAMTMIEIIGAYKRKI